MNKDIWQQILAGDDKAYEDLYAEYFRKFYNFGMKFTRDSTLVEDTIQEVFLELWSKRSKIADIEYPKAYFSAAFRFILLQRLRKQQFVSNIIADAGPDFTIERRIINQEHDRELSARLQLALNNLTARQREAIFLRFYEGLSYEEVASVMKVTVKGAYKLIGRSLGRLREAGVAGR